MSKDASTNFRCEYCDVNIQAKEDFERHCKGRKHLSNQHLAQEQEAAKRTIYVRGIHEKKFDVSRAQDVMVWMEAVLGRKLHSDVKSLKSEQDFAGPLKDGVALCELLNTINPGAIKKINNNKTAFKQMENIELFTKGCKEYGMNPLDIFQMTDLYETKAMYTVFNCLHALGSLALKKGFAGPNYGIKISDTHERHFTAEQIAKGNQIIPMQAGTNKVPSQSGMSPYGLSRQIIPSDSDLTEPSPASQAFVSLQYGTNKTATQCGMTPYGLGRQIVSMSSVSDDTIGSDAVSSTNSDVATDKDLYDDDNSLVDEVGAKAKNLFIDDNTFVEEAAVAMDRKGNVDDNYFVQEGVAMDKNGYVDDNSFVQEGVAVDKNGYVEDNNFVQEGVAMDKNGYVDDNNCVQEEVALDNNLIADENNFVQEDVDASTNLFIDESAFVKEGVL